MLETPASTVLRLFELQYPCLKSLALALTQAAMIELQLLKLLRYMLVVVLRQCQPEWDSDSETLRIQV